MPRKRGKNIKQTSTRDLKQQQPARRKDGTLKAKPKPKVTAGTDRYMPKPVDSSWITAIRHIDGLVGVQIYDKKRKRNVTYYYQDYSGKHYQALSKAQRQGSSVGMAYWRENLKNKSFLKRRSRSAKKPTKSS